LGFRVVCASLAERRESFHVAQACCDGAGPDNRNDETPNHGLVRTADSVLSLDEALGQRSHRPDVRPTLRVGRMGRVSLRLVRRLRGRTSG